jgi:serine/threonine protein kinase
MNVEARQQTLTERWPQWPSAVINGVYPLRRILHSSDHGAVFLTERSAESASSEAAIKIVRTTQVLTELQLRHWRTAAAISHPHLIRLFDSGHCVLEGEEFLFLVMEYAEQTLAQVLSHRALTADEVREMLPPALGALSFLHRRNFVHGQLKPANFLVVGDQLKLASESVRPAGEPRARTAESSLDDPPEANYGRLSPAGDMWGLGITLVEALTQSLPWPDAHSATAGLPATLPAEFLDPVQRCLSHDPTGRPTAGDLEAAFKPAPPEPVAPAPPALVAAAPAPAAPAPELPGRRPSVPVIAAVTLLTLLVAIWAGLRAVHHPSNSPRASASAAPIPAQHAPAPVSAAPSPETPVPVAPKARAPSPAAAAREPKTAAARSATRPPDRPAKPAASGLPSVVHAQIPAASHTALRTIHGHVKVAVLVVVDHAGNVIDALLANPGPSTYFAHLARDAARKWQFAPAADSDSRQWLLRFEFTRAGATADATPRA